MLWGVVVVGVITENTEALEHLALSARLYACFALCVFVLCEVSCRCGPLDSVRTLVIMSWNLLRLGVECTGYFFLYLGSNAPL